MRMKMIEILYMRMKMIEILYMRNKEILYMRMKMIEILYRFHIIFTGSFLQVTHFFKCAYAFFKCAESLIFMYYQTGKLKPRSLKLEKSLGNNK
jgi:hypothetical protein